MLIRALIILAVVATLPLATLASTARPSRSAQCAARPDQPDSEAEIRMLERQWSQAYWTGHTDFLECLYAPNFISISADGKMHDGAHDIAGSVKFSGRAYKPHAWPTDVLMYPGIAIATSTGIHDMHGLRVTDIYAYDGHHWHAIFSQDTKI